MLIFSFALATVVLFLQGVNLPGVPMNAYVPWIAVFVLKSAPKKDLFKPLAGAAAAGILVDLLSDLPFGLYPISYTLAAAILFRFRNRFLYDNPFHLTVFASFTSLLVSILQIFFLFLFDRRLPISGQWIIIDWLATSLIDGIYALVCFSGLLYLWIKARRHWMLFWLKKKRSHA
jgi:rod shape-determining protein MreD